jgi:hypothetical protein
MELGPVDYKSIQLCYNLFESSEEQKFSSDIGIRWVDFLCLWTGPLVYFHSLRSMGYKGSDG